MSFMTALRSFLDRLKDLRRILLAFYVPASHEFIHGMENSSAPSAAGKSVRVAIADLMLLNVMLKTV